MSRARASGVPFALLLLPTLLLCGCARSPEAIPSAADTIFTDARFLAGVGPQSPHAPLDALFAPGAQQATAWLPDGTLWNGDVELAFTDSAGAPVRFLPTWQAAHVDLPAAWRRGDGFGVKAYLPWRGGDVDTAGWTRLEVDLGQARRLRFALRSGAPTEHPLHPYAPIADSFAYDARVERGGREACLLREGRTVALVVARGEGRPVLARIEGVPPSRVAPDRRVGLLVARNDADSTAVRLDVWLAPVGGAAADANPPDRDESFAASAARTVAAWRTEMGKGATFELPDSRLQAAFVNAHRLLVGNRERRNGQVHFLGSPFQYRDLYLRDGARVVHALGLLGRADLAGEALASLYRFQWPGGAFLSQRGQLDGTGQALWALGSYASLGGERATVDRLLEPALRGARWIAVQRASSTLRGGPAAGLLPYADPRDNELARGHLLGNDAWAIAGLEAIVPLLRARGRAATADTLEAEARTYRATLLAAWDHAARAQGRPLPPVLEGGGRDWGNLSATYPCAIVTPGDARAVTLDRWMRAHRNRDGLFTCGLTDSVHHYLGFDLTQAALRRGDRAAVRADLAAILSHTQRDGSGFELASRDGGYGENLPPHGTFAAMLVDLVRSAIVYERGDSLVLLAGAHPGGDPVGPLDVRGAPTRFGTLDLAVNMAPDRGGALIEGSLPAPAIVDWPPASRVRAVIDARGATRPVSNGRFTLPAGRGRWRVEFEPERGAGR